MSLFEEEKQDSLDVFRFLYFNRKAIIYAFIVGGIIAGAVSFMLPKKYKSTGILYPPNSYVRDRLIENPQFGHELEVEHLIQILESSNVRDSVIAQFNLAAYYDVDTSSVQWKDKLNEYYVSDVSFQRSPYISVIIEATILVVEVFPCVPAIAMPLLVFIRLESISALARIGIDLFFASLISGLLSEIALETTTISTFLKLDAEWSKAISIPKSIKRLVMSDSFLSDPVTV